MSLNIVEASIAELQHALSSGTITSVELVAKYLLRINTYDCRGICLNSIPILNPDVFTEAAASDARRTRGEARGPLEGIPYTLKDSMKYKGKTCASGSPAFEHLIANEDSFVAEQLRKAGAVCIGRTNTPPMMASGMHRGVYGRAESPYNLDYLTAAFSSGSSNGSATSTAASFAAFGLGTETVSSGRSPASNNALIAYTPSRNVISGRGIWPLYPTCDVLVPHARSLDDMLTILDVLTAEDSRGVGEFWRAQKFVQIPQTVRPDSSYLDLRNAATNSLRGKRIAVPKMYIGEKDHKGKPTYTSPDVIEIWRQAKADLEAIGATIIESDFPLVTNYEDDTINGMPNYVAGFKPDWNAKERGELVAYLWDDFLKENNDPECSSLTEVDGANIFPRPKDYVADRYMEIKNFIDYPGMIEIARNRKGKSLWEIDGIAEALPALEAQRKRDFEDWMDSNRYDLVVFPANGDVGRSDVDTNDESARHALQWGVKYSNGNRAIRHMGVPTVSVPMGTMATSKMPVNLTFAGHAYTSDSQLLRYAYAFERQTRHRRPPPLTPVLPTDDIILNSERSTNSASMHMQPSTALPEVRVTYARRSDANRVRVEGKLSPARIAGDVQLEVYVDAKLVSQEDIRVSESDGIFSFETAFAHFEPAKPLYGGVGLVVGKIIVMIIARSPAGAIGALTLID
ncbi:amidase signature enzyme [Polychaeton citri CBS 116435]|uniref:Amidase signature enzyme n=1 Tax=Polychaeton citri CBS 116435 TaxID=1314669 RepID=A0A9P4Q930_9PEZI|nr:amidase signature enzyme [Polychaeton citri CBS 116435]